MNKFLKIIKNILLLITIILIIIFDLKYQFGNWKILLLNIGILVMLIISIKDIKYKKITSNKYNLLFISAMLITIFILCRTLFDPMLNFNKEEYDIVVIHNVLNNFDINYLSQNVYFLLILYICLYIYNKIDSKKTINIKSKFSVEIIICLIINILLIPEILVTFGDYLQETSFPLLLFAVTTLLLVVEIVSLIKRNGTKHEWPIYICFFFNLFSYIAIFT